MDFYSQYIDQAKKEAEEIRKTARTIVEDHPLYGKKFTLWIKIKGANIDSHWYSDAATDKGGINGVEWNDDLRWGTKLKALELEWVFFLSGVNPNLDKTAEPLILPPDYLKLYGIDFKKVYGHLPKSQQSEYKLQAHQRTLEAAKEASVKANKERPKGIIGEWLDKLSGEDKKQKYDVTEVPMRIADVLIKKHGAIIENGFIYIP